MSSDLEIFIASDQEIEGFIYEIEELFDIHLSSEIDLLDNTFYYNNGLGFRLQRHSYLPDRINFEEYRYCFTFRYHGVTKIQPSPAVQEFFNKLKSTGRYRLALTRDLQAVLETFDP